MGNGFKLTSNEKKVRKKLEKFPRGVKVKVLTKELYMGKTAVYEALNSLEIKELAFRGGQGLWLPKPHLKHEDSKASKKRVEFFEWLDRRAERKRKERKEEADEYDRQTRIIKAQMRLLEMRQEYKCKRPQSERNKPIPLAIVSEMEKKVRQHYGLSETDPL